MSDAILVLDAGAAQIRFSLFAADARPGRDSLVCGGACAGIGDQVRFTANNALGLPLIDESLAVATTHEDAIAVLFGWLEGCFPAFHVIAAGHRIAHGGSLLTAPVRIDAAVVAELRRLIPLAPFTQPPNITALVALIRLFPSLEQVACFDTAFHRTLPNVATAFALPRAIAADGVRRYGFHGLSYEYVAGELRGVAGAKIADGRVVVAHLGRGASMCAMYEGKSVATTTDESDLAGMSGLTDDLSELLENEGQAAREAVALFVYRVGRELGSMAAALGGIDALVFTAASGEHLVEIRRRVCESASWLGIDIDQAANAVGAPCITRRESRTSAWVVPSHERLMIARHVWTIVKHIPSAAARTPFEGAALSAAREY